MLTRRFVGRQSAVISKERIQRPVLSNIAYTIQSKPVAEARKIVIFAAIFHKSPYGYHLLSLDASYTPIQAWSNIKHITPIRSIAVRDVGEFKRVLNLPCFKTLQEIHLNDAAPLVPLPENVKVIAYCNISILVLLDGLKESLKAKEHKNVSDNKTNTLPQPSAAKNADSSPSGSKTKKGRNKHKRNNNTCNSSNNNDINDENYNGIDNTDATAISPSPSHVEKGKSKRKVKKGKSNSNGNCKNDTALTAINGSNGSGSVGGASSSNTDDEDTISSNNNTTTTIVNGTTATSLNSKNSNKKRNKKLERAINRCVSYDTLLLFHPEMTINEYHKFCKASN